jgi:hypothetical protein
MNMHLAFVGGFWFLLATNVHGLSPAHTPNPSCPASYGAVVTLVHAPDQINSVLLRLQPTHYRTSLAGTYHSPQSEPFQLYPPSGGVMQYFNVHYSSVRLT